MSYAVVFALFAYTPVRDGGLSRDVRSSLVLSDMSHALTHFGYFQPEEIGFTLASAGVIGAIIQVLILPNLQRRYGTLTLYRFFMSLWPVVYLLFPILNLVARHTIKGVYEEGYDTEPAGLAVWFLVALSLSLSRLAAMSFS